MGGLVVLTHWTTGDLGLEMNMSLKYPGCSGSKQNAYMLLSGEPLMNNSSDCPMMKHQQQEHRMQTKEVLAQLIRGFVLVLLISHKFFDFPRYGLHVVNDQLIQIGI